MTEEHAPKHVDHRKLPMTTIAVVVAFVLGALGAVVYVKWNDSTPSTQSVADEVGTPPSKADPTQATSGVDVSACLEHLSAGDEVVDVAKTGIGHWREHTGAQADWVADKVSTAKVKAIWKRTRLAGPTDVKDFGRTMKAMLDTEGCDGADGACQERATDLTAAVDAAKAAMTGWETHLGNMAAFKDGEMSPDRAQTEWDKAWKAAPKDINAFNRAEKALAAAPACTGS